MENIIVSQVWIDCRGLYNYLKMNINLIRIKKLQWPVYPKVINVKQIAGRMK